MTAKKINTAAAGMYAHHVAPERRWIAAFNTSLDVIDAFRGATIPIWLALAAAGLFQLRVAAYAAHAGAEGAAQ